MSINLLNKSCLYLIKHTAIKVCCILCVYVFNACALIPQGFADFCFCIVSGFKGKDCSLDIDLCSFGMCSEHTLKCTKTKDGQNFSCTCERGEQVF